MPWLEDVANVALRVPSLLALDLLYKCDVESFTDHIKARNEDMLFKYKYLIWNVYYVGEFFCHLNSRVTNIVIYTILTCV